MATYATRLGGRVFNHDDFSGDAEAEYDRLRGLAHEEAERRNRCFQRSQEAYDAGDGAAAKELSNEGKAHGRKMDDYNRQASEFIFRENNATDRVDADTIDLHGQYVEEAEDILEARIKEAQARGQSHLHVIVGKGNHSANHVQKIKPRVERVCREQGLEYHTEENEGRIYVKLRAGGGGHHQQPTPPPEEPYRPPHHGGSSGHHQNQSHHQQQQQNEMVEKLLVRAVKKLGDCCVVM